MKVYFTEQTNFYGSSKPSELIREYGSPLYVYNESILRQRCRELAGLVSYSNYRSNYSIKANSNLELLKIIRDEGLHADAMSPGEIHVLLAAGYRPDEILFVANNVSAEEMQYAIDKGVLVSCDSLSQLRQYGRLNPGGKVAVRFNPGVGAGHHAKVVTGGENTKFGINLEMMDEVKAILKEYRLSLAGINQHIGSLFMEPSSYLQAARALLNIASNFEDLEFIDMGGGFGIPYRKQEGQQRLDLEEMGRGLSQLMEDWTANYGKRVRLKIEPGRYVVAECGVLLGTVHAVKQNGSKTYIGTDVGFNVLIRPAMYDSHHDIEFYRNDAVLKTDTVRKATVVGNICESGDIIANDRELPEAAEGDIIGVMDAGAYGYSMSSNYNNRLRPAEVLIGLDGSPRLIRRRDTFEDLMRGFI
ncbi:MAG TPA: diaminopimelate decarboxylase [Clostridiales bacterium]|nr:diaminopimelate decarboxylase [Clostridiales bacterium]HOL91770.1 diaminopimelate decarboxylase [Clostridiales bacterium]HPP36326.1 diaminopimelate decarboxylase [Clostridiales bacterium]